MSKTKVVFCWSDISGYMAACWRALLAYEEMDVFVVAFRAKTESAFADELMQCIPHRLLDEAEREDAGLLKQLVREQQADVLVLCGWFHRPYRTLADVFYGQSRLIMGMDTPWWATLKQRLAPLVLRSYLKKMNHIVVPGERAWQYAYRLLPDTRRISKGMYGIDFDFFAEIHQGRSKSSWPKSFLFVGRYAEVKGIGTLMQAYRQYRQQCEGEPWPLVCCGKGPLEDIIENEEGVINRGFVQPHAMRDIWSQAGCFILPSRFDPWPLVIIEACAAGLPVICTDVCGSSVELVRDHYNGMTFAKEDAQGMRDALLNLHRMEEEDLRSWGENSLTLARPYAADRWAARWCKIIQKQ